METVLSLRLRERLLPIDFVVVVVVAVAVCSSDLVLNIFAFLLLL